MYVRGLELPDAQVFAAYNRFQESLSCRRRKGILTFWELLDQFAILDVSFSVIAERHGVSRQRIYQIYRFYFASFFGSWRERELRELEAQRKQLLFQDFSQAQPWLRTLVAVARELGFSVERVECFEVRGARRFRRTQIMVNGKRCAVRRVRSVYRYNPCARRRYSKFRVSGALLDCEVCIILQNVLRERRIFVIPTSHLRDAGCGRKGLYIPVERTVVRKTGEENFSWFAYENAWHFLS